MLSYYIEAICEYSCWIFSFNEASRLIWLSIIWFISECITRIIVSQNGIPKIGYQVAKSEDHSSWWLIITSSIVMLGIVFLVLHGRWLPDLPVYLIPIGILLMVIGISLRIWAVVILGKFFTVQVKIFSHHHLIDIGPYRWLRHPSYLGIFLTATGLGLATGYLIVTLSFLIILSIVLGYRIHVEERALKEKFGNAWQAYSDRTWAIFPWIF